ncbi:MAG: hypothetical protein ACTSQV_09165 [Alphaproteobacteria bacterium]
MIDINSSDCKQRSFVAATALPNHGAAKARLAATLFVWLNAAMTRRQAGKKREKP